MLYNCYIQRDDCTGLAFGGNKTRKLEFLIADAQAQRCDTIITAGAVQSNHCRQTAAACARVGLRCVLVLNGNKPDSPTSNLLLDVLFGASVIYVDNRADRERIMVETFEKIKSEGRVPYLMPVGGSTPVGAMGYAFAVQEMMTQMTPDAMVFGTSSAGTHAGMILGSRVFRYHGRVIGVSIDASTEWLKQHVCELATRASDVLGDHIDFTGDDVDVTDAYCTAGYGVLTDAEREAIQLFAKYEGILLDPVYTGRAAAGLIDMIRKGAFKKSQKVLFWNTGGQPALFADKYQTNIL